MVSRRSRSEPLTVGVWKTVRARFSSRAAVASLPRIQHSIMGSAKSQWARRRA